MRPTPSEAHTVGAPETLFETRRGPLPAGPGNARRRSAASPVLTQRRREAAAAAAAAARPAERAAARCATEEHGSRN